MGGEYQLELRDQVAKAVLPALIRTTDGLEKYNKLLVQDAFDIAELFLQQAEKRRA
jgi:hypothetical protein